MEHNSNQPLNAKPVNTPSPPAAEEQQQTTAPAAKPPRLDTTATRPARKHRQPSADLPSANQIFAEYQYLFGDLERQNARAVALLRSVEEKRAQLEVATSAAEARRLRKALGFAQSQFAAAEQQERLVCMRLSDLFAQLQSHHRLAQLQSERHLQQLQQSQTQPPPPTPASALPPPTAATQAPAGPRVTFAEASPIVHEHDDGGGDGDGGGSPWADRIPLTPYASSFPSPFSSPYAPPPSSPSAPMPSPMSPLAPVFRPRSGFFADATAAVVAVAAEDQQSGQDSLDSVLAAVAEATQETLGPVSGPGGGCTDEEDGEAAVYDDDEDNDTGDYVVVSGTDAKSGPVRRMSHSAAPRPQNKLKRMSLPVRLSWPDEVQ